MKGLLGAAVGVLLAVLAVSDTTAQDGAQAEVVYSVPGQDRFRPIYENLKQRGVLEELRDFISPLKLTRPLQLRLDQCDAPASPFRSGGPIVVCYEAVARLVELADKLPADGKTPRGVTRDDAIVGGFVQIALHQTALAVFDMFQLPVWGRMEDAADKLAGYMMLQFGTELARRTLGGAAYFFQASDRTWTGADFSDVSSPEAQRFYNYLCIAYGGDPAAFRDFVQLEERSAGGAQSRQTRSDDLLPSRRAARCAGEYSDLNYAFTATILPHVDAARMRAILARRDWLQAPGAPKATP